MSRRLSDKIGKELIRVLTGMMKKDKLFYIGVVSDPHRLFPGVVSLPLSHFYYKQGDVVLLRSTL